MEYRNNNNKFNNLINLDECRKKINNSDNTFLGKGGQGSVYKLESPTCGSVVLKTYHKKTNEKEIYREVNVLDRVKNIIDKDICPHFVYYYDFFKSKDSENHTIMNIIMEYADGDLEKWVKEVHTEEEWISMIFQFITGVHTIQKYLKGFHSDLKPKNIFFKEIKNGKDNYFEYQIDKNKYYIKNTGYLFMLADYGHFQSSIFDNNNMADSDIQIAIRDNKDFNFMKDFVKRIKVSNLLDKYKLNDLINMFSKNNDFKEYLEKEKKEINKTMSHLPKHILDKFLTRNILYYCLEKDLIDYNKEKKLGLKESMIPPDSKISKFIEDILSEEGDIEIILDKYYKNYQIKSEKLNIIKSFNLNQML